MTVQSKLARRRAAYASAQAAEDCYACGEMQSHVIELRPEVFRPVCRDCWIELATGYVSPEVMEPVHQFGGVKRPQGRSHLESLMIEEDT